jgi:oxygen-independent coproporphyrinogen-3 oxidase
MAGMRQSASILYLDGGGAAALSVPQLESLGSALLAPVEGRPALEWTVTATPNALTPMRIEALLALGVNRLCIPVDAGDCPAGVETVFIAREAGFERVAVDLSADLAAIPLDVWNRVLEGVEEAGAGHISTYDTGENRDDSERSLLCLEAADAFLHDAGYARYELWSYALPGHACAYTVTCWKCRPYVGLGPGAASHDGVTRWTNTEDVDAYCAALEKGDLPPREVESFTPELKASDMLLCGLNLAEGIHLASVRSEVERVFQTLENPGPQFSKHWKTLEHTFAQLADEGLVVEEDGHWRLSERGRYMADYVARALV